MSISIIELSFGEFGFITGKILLFICVIPKANNRMNSGGQLVRYFITNLATVLKVLKALFVLFVADERR